MSLPNLRHTFLVATITIIVFLGSACTLSASQSVQPTSEISSALLTKVAATIQVQIASTRAQDTLSTPLPTNTTLSKPAVSNTNTPTFTATQQPTLTNTPTQKPTLTPTRTSTLRPSQTPTATSTIVPTSTRPVAYGLRYTIDGVNLHDCFGTPWVVFTVYNGGTKALESAYLYVRDVTTNHSLVGPISSNAPFMDSDRSCYTANINRLDSGQLLYLGESLGIRALKGHTLRATIELCDQENLRGTCVKKVIDFVVP
ncbi:MAG: hypothetical protein AB1894_08905 [Chloroflexota bacterium]